MFWNPSKTAPLLSARNWWVGSIYCIALTYSHPWPCIAQAKAAIASLPASSTGRYIVPLIFSTFILFSMVVLYQLN